MIFSARRVSGWLTAAALASGLTGAAQAEDKPAGLVATLTSGGVTDLQLSPNVQLFVPAGESATPFLPAGPVVATWTGFITSELRAEYTFHAEFVGELKITVGDATAVAGQATDGKRLSGSAVRLNKGANPVKVEYHGPAQGDAFLRLFWSSKELPVTPVPLALFTHDASPELTSAGLRHAGREAFVEFRCAKCHTVEGGTMPELGADAPQFTGLGGRRNYDWLAKWIQDPGALRPGTPMPAVFTGSDAKEKAEAVAAYLASLAGETKYATSTGDVAAGKTLYEKFNCVACHVAPDASDAPAPGKISQKGVKAKFTPGALAAFLRRPEEHFQWIRMPNFRLSAEEAGNLAAYLESKADAPADRPAPTDAAVISRGKSLVQSAGCLNCHTLDVPNQFTTKKLTELAAANWNSGCVADAPKAEAKAPVYRLSTEQRTALRAFAATDRTSLNRSIAADFLERQSQALNCRQCHGVMEGVPKYDLLIGKLKPAWAARFIAGQDPVKPRPWAEHRMPGFPAYAAQLATGLATHAGLPPQAEPDPIAENAKELAEAGRKLVSANGGLSCTQCHSVGEFGATAVFEAPGINLAWAQNRLQPSYFRRWLRNPQSVDPETKMPAYFDAETGASPLTDILAGDGPKTIQAVWEYLRLGDKMPKPE